MIFRPATSNDIEDMHIVRVSVLENRLSDPNRIKPEDYREYLEQRGTGWVCEERGSIVGFAIIDLVGKNVWALFVSPAHEAKGIGRQLHQQALDWYFKQTEETLWLSTEPGTRAEKFYHQSGWEEKGKHGNEIRFEMSAIRWKELARQSAGFSTGS